jgi:hypothetical protein
MEKVMQALDFLTAEEERLRAQSIAADQAANHAKALADVAEEQWRETKDALKNLTGYISYVQGKEV